MTDQRTFTVKLTREEITRTCNVLIVHAKQYENRVRHIRSGAIKGDDVVFENVANHMHGISQKLLAALKK